MSSITHYLPEIGLNDLKSPLHLAKSFAAELIGALILVLVGCGSCIGGDSADFVRIALAFGVTVATLAQSVGHVSGCHINPAVTIGLFLARKIGLIKGIFYIIAQLLGAVCGAFILEAVTSSSIRGSKTIGVTAINPELSPIQGVIVEFFITFVLVLVVFGAAADENNEVKGSAPLAIGLSITACNLFAIPYTGSSMNPARSFGPAAVSGYWDNHWVYWVGPILGGIAASYSYQILFKAPSTESYNVVSDVEK